MKSASSTVRAVNRAAVRPLLLGAIITPTVPAVLAVLPHIHWATLTAASPVEIATPGRWDVLAAALLTLALCAWIARHHLRTLAARVGRAVGAATVLAVLAGLLAAAAPWSPPQQATATAAAVDFRAADQRAVTALVDVDGAATPPTAGWTSGVEVDVLVRYEQATGDRRLVGGLAATWASLRGWGQAHMPAPGGGPDYSNQFYDDSLWWGLTWLDAYRLTGDPRYLATAEGIGAWAVSGLTPICGGGMVWATTAVQGGGEKNAITNELWMALNAELAATTHGAVYLQRAETAWAWLSRSGLIQPDGIVVDHLDAACHPTSGPLSYTQGVVLSGLTYLGQASGDGRYLKIAQRLADASTTSPALNVDGILRDPCEPECPHSGQEFKGIYLAALGTLNAALADHPYTSYLDRQAASAYRHDRLVGDLYGESLAGPPDTASPARQATVVALYTATIGETQ